MPALNVIQFNCSFDNICTECLPDKVKISNELYSNTAKFEKFKGKILREIEERSKQKIKQVRLRFLFILPALERKGDEKKKIKDE